MLNSGHLQYRSVADLDRAIVRAMPRLPGAIDLVVGVPRSGLLAANLLALHLNLPLADLDGYLEGRVLAKGNRALRPSDGDAARRRRVVIVDDSVASGSQIRLCRERVARAGLSGTDDIAYLAAFVAPGAEGLVDVACEVVPCPRAFEWNLMHRETLARACVDIDGVLCEDPAHDDNDDGPRYEAFLDSARPLLRPSRPVGWLVTSRLEKYRERTEAWLRSQGVEWGELVMMDLPDAAARFAAGPRGRWKGRVYRGVAANLFVESDHRQAIDIARVSGKPALSIERNELVSPTGLAAAGGAARDVPGRLRRLPGSLRRRARRLAASFKSAVPTSG